MDNKKVYSIVIEGVEKSINQVDALSDSLQFLDKKIKEMESRTVNVQSTTSSGGSSRVSELKTEDQLMKQIQKTEQEIANARREDYQRLLAEKDILKEAKDIQEQRAASERLTSANYANTMKGMKQELADIKSVMQTTDLGSEEFDKLTKRAGELTQKLKDIEAAYGQFGRNVGNYASAAEGFGKFTVQVGDSVREFSSAREAARQLKQELLSIGEGAEGVDELKAAITRVDSAIKDATVSSEAMDNALDWTQSFMAMAQAEQGLTAFFGLEDTKIDETIKNLLALQNALNGIEKIMKQLQSGEGVGKYFSKASKGIDDFTNKLFGVKKASKEAATAEKAQATATSAVGNASKGATAGLAAQSAANVAVATTSKVAEVCARALGMALKALGIGLVLEGIAWLVEGVKAAGSAIVDLFSESEEELEKYQARIEGVKTATEQLSKEVEHYKEIGAISEMQAMTEEFRIQAEAINKTYEAMRKMNGIESTPERLAVVQYLRDIKEASNEAAKAMEDYANGVEGSEERLRNAKATIRNLYAEFANNEVIQKAAKDMGKFFDNEGFGKGADAIIENLNRVYDAFNNLEAKMKSSKQKLDEYLMTPLEREIAAINQKEKEMFEAAGNDMAKQAQVREKAAQERQEAIDKHNKEELEKQNRHNSTKLKAEETIESLRLRLMENSLIKKLNQLEKEKTNTLAKVNGTQAEILQIERMYNDLRLKEIKNYVKQVEKQYDSLKESVVSTENQIKKSLINVGIAETEYESNLESTTRAIQNTIISLDEYNEKVKDLVKTYGSLDKVQERFDIADTFNGLRNKPEGEQLFLNEWLKRQSKDLQNEMLDLWNSLEGTTEHKTEVWVASLREVFTSEYEKELRLVREFAIQYSKSLDDSVRYRLEAEEGYKKGVLESRMALQQELLEKEKELAQLELQEAQKAAWKKVDAVQDQYEEQVKKLQEVIDDIGALGANATKEQLQEFFDAKQKLEEIEKDYQNVQKQAQDNFQKEMEIADEEYSNKIKEIELKRYSEIAAINALYYREQLQNYRDFQTRFNEEIQKQPTYDKLGFGIVNIAQTKKSYKELQKAVEVSLKRIKDDKEELTAEFSNSLITPEVYNQTLRELNDMETSFSNTAQDIAANIKNIGVEFWSSINDWVQQIGQATSSILSSLSDIASNEYDWLISEQEKYINKYEELLNKQDEITQDHADKVNSIEDELSTARGDRRQQLIDALNAEMAAQRASLAQEKKIEKEKEKAEDKKKKLEHEQAVKKKEMDLWQARINAAMAVSMAAVNNWPIPAIPMMAMAAAVGAAQIAAVRSQNIPEYAEGGILDGGVIDGKPHSRGGVKVYGGMAELEGYEYIVNKRTTIENEPLLDYINTRKKRLTLDDFVDYYTSKSSKVSKNITSSSPRAKFADGGILSISNNIDLSSRLLTAFEDYSNRPIYVAVTEIEDRMADVRNVRVLSGLEQ